MSAHKTPHYSHIVHDINSRGGLKMYFGRRGDQGEGWVRHLDAVVPENGVLLHELHTVDSGPSRYDTQLHTQLHKKAAERGTAVLPAGFYGEHVVQNGVPTFKPQELLSLMPKSAHHLTSDMVDRYQDLQSIREMRGAVGSLAWLAAHMGTHAAEYAARPAVLWGRTHSSSLPDMYQRLGVSSVEVKELDAPLRYSYLQPHGLRWSEADIQNTFQKAYLDALKSFTLDKNKIATTI